MDEIFGFRSTLLKIVPERPLHFSTSFFFFFFSLSPVVAARSPRFVHAKFSYDRSIQQQYFWNKHIPDDLRDILSSFDHIAARKTQQIDSTHSCTTQTRKLGVANQVIPLAPWERPSSPRPLGPRRVRRFTTLQQELLLPPSTLTTTFIYRILTLPT